MEGISQKTYYRCTILKSLASKNSKHLETTYLATHFKDLNCRKINRTKEKASGCKSFKEEVENNGNDITNRIFIYSICLHLMTVNFRPPPQYIYIRTVSS